MTRAAMALAATAALLLGSFIGSAPALAQAKADAKAAPVKLEKKDLDRGMKEAPAVQAASGAPCQVSAAAFRGEGTQKTPDGKSQKVTIYETACTGGLGYLLVAPQGAKPQAFDCLASQSASTSCALPQNADPKQGLAGFVTAAGKTCAISDGKYLGTSQSGASFYEVACGSAPGYRISAPQTGAATVAPCAELLDTPNACTMTTKAQVIAGLQPIVQQSGKTCQVSDARWVGEGTQSGDTFYEFGCGAQPGFMAVVDKGGKLKQALDCSKAQGIGGGCKFTDTTVAETADIATYTKLAAKAGYPCTVSKYRFIGTDKQNREVVELACANRPDGALALFSQTGPSQIVDCVQAGAYGQSCKLSSPDAVYAKYTQALAAKGKTTCKVSGAGFLGTTASGEQFVETACADGQPGWVIGLNGGGGYSAKEVLSCTQARAAGVACKLPTNQPKS